jgi:hypothetical protein
MFQVQCESCHWWQHFQCTTIQKTFNEVNQEDYRFICAHGRWFSQGTLASSTTKTGRHDIAEILLKVELNTKIQPTIKRYVKYQATVNLLLL